MLWCIVYSIRSILCVPPGCNSSLSDCVIVLSLVEANCNLRRVGLMGTMTGSGLRGASYNNDNNNVLLHRVACVGGQIPFLVQLWCWL